jgi:putative peptidoglycan lipid II flippase
MLNTLHRFAAAAAAPIFLNISVVVALAFAAFFPTAGHAAAWGVLIAGILEYLLLAADTARTTGLPRLRRPEFDADVRKFFRALGPAVIGSGGVQLALFADTIIASFLPVGAVSALYYADRIDQLPIGVIGIAAGTVLLPEMARYVAAGDEAGARNAQNRAIEFTLLLSVPCLVAFLVVPDAIMRGLFMHGRFTGADADAAALTLAAYALGLLPFVLIRSVVASFYARGDTATPVKAALVAVAANIVFKLLLMGPLAQVGLALATSIGAWINFGLVLWFASRAGYARVDPRLRQGALRLAVAGAILAVVLWLCQNFVTPLVAGLSSFRQEVALAALVVVGALVYGAAVAALLGLRWLKAFRDPAATI